MTGFCFFLGVITTDLDTCALDLEKVNSDTRRRQASLFLLVFKIANVSDGK